MSSTNLSRQKIGEVALAIADRQGFRAVTMRRIAQELKVGTMSLYYYVKTKDDLMAVMDDVLMGEIVLPSLPKNWRSAVLEIALRTHAVLTRHSWALATMLAAPPGQNAMRHMEQCLRALDRAPMNSRQKLALLATVDDFVFGHALREASSRMPDRPPDFVLRLLETGEFPHLQEVLREASFENGEGRLRRGLTALLDAWPSK
jgi:AcrR family transcriptional regulator